jgi:flagellin
MITGMSTLDTQRVLTQTQATLERSLARLASGQRITSAADDATGLAIADQLAQGVALDAQGEQNVADALSAVQAADQTLGSITAIDGRLSALAAEAANGLLTGDQRGAIQQEASALTSEVDQIASQPGLNGTKLLQSGSIVTVQAGPAAGDQIALPAVDASTTALGLAGLDLSTPAGAQAGLAATTAAADVIAQDQGAFAAAAGQLGTAAGSLPVAQEQSLAANAPIADTDVARESTAATVSSTLMQLQVRAFAQENRLSGVLLSVVA